jgi:hypothetical protein
VTPFANDHEAETIAGLTIENRTAGVTVSGNLEIRKDQAGLQQAIHLQRLADALVSALQGLDLPELAAPRIGSGDTVPNPFR